MPNPEERRTISFYSTVAANSEKVLVSRRVPYKFRTIRFIANFALNTNRTLLIYFYLSPDKSVPTSKPTTGIDLLSLIGYTSYLVGDDERKEIDHTVEADVGGMYLKVYANNTDSFEHTIDAQIIIEPFERG